jgi:anti-sigma factor RsiW
MTDDDLLSRLGALVREEEHESDPVLDKLVHGKLTQAERAELEARARQDAELAHKVSQLTPVDDQVRARIVQSALASLPGAPATKATVSQLRPRRRSMWLAPAGIALSAAAAALIMLRSPAVDEIPSYALTARGGVDLQRGSTREGPLVLAPDSTLEVVLRPGSDVHGRIEVHGLVLSGAQSQELVLHPELSPTGSVRIRELTRTLFGDRKGAHELVLVPCRPEACEGALVEAKGHGQTRGPGWESLSQQLVLE